MWFSVIFCRYLTLSERYDNFSKQLTRLIINQRWSYCSFLLFCSFLVWICQVLLYEVCCQTIFFVHCFCAFSSAAAFRSFPGSPVSGPSLVMRPFFIFTWLYSVKYALRWDCQLRVTSGGVWGRTLSENKLCNKFFITSWLIWKSSCRITIFSRSS